MERSLPRTIHNPLEDSGVSVGASQVAPQLSSSSTLPAAGPGDGLSGRTAPANIPASLNRSMQTFLNVSKSIPFGRMINTGFIESCNSVICPDPLPFQDIDPSTRYDIASWRDPSDMCAMRNCQPFPVAGGLKPASNACTVSRRSGVRRRYTSSRMPSGTPP